MNSIGKMQPVIILCSTLIGLVLGQFTRLGNISSGLIEVFLMLLLYILFLTVDLKHIRKSYKNMTYTITATTINFVITPLIAYGLGRLFFASEIDIRMGLIMLLVTPCTDWYLVFTGLSKGNVALNMSILPLNLILQVVLMPVYLFLFLSSELHLNFVDLVLNMLLVLLIPFIFALISKKLIENRENIKAMIDKQCDNLQLLFLCIAVIIMFASEGKNLFENPMLLLKMFIPLVLFFALVFIIGQGIGRFLNFEKQDIIALNFTTLARNSPLSLAIAVTAFPDRPLIALSLIIGPLIELPILSFISSYLLRWQKDDEIEIVAE